MYVGICCLGFREKKLWMYFREFILEREIVLPLACCLYQIAGFNPYWGNFFVDNL